MYREPLDCFPNLQNYSAFSFGQQICPGMNIAKKSLYILTARILWAGQFSKMKGQGGREIEVPEYDYTTGFNTQPNRFTFSYVPCAANGVEILEAAWINAQVEDPLQEYSEFDRAKGDEYICHSLCESSCAGSVRTRTYSESINRIRWFFFITYGYGEGI